MTLVAVVVEAEASCDACETGFAVTRCADSLPCPSCGAACEVELSIAVTPPFAAPACPRCQAPLEAGACGSCGAALAVRPGERGAVSFVGEGAPGWLAVFELDAIDRAIEAATDARHLVPAVRAAVAANPATEPSRLTQLAEDVADDVREAVAGNPATPPAVLATLAPTAWAACANPRLPVEAMATLAGATESWVRGAIAANPGTPAEILLRLAGDPETAVRREVVRNPAATAAVLARLAEDPDWKLRRAVARHANTEARTLKRLAGDKHDDVAATARIHPACPVWWRRIF